MSRYLLRILKDRAGASESIEFSVIIAILLAVFYILTMAFTPFIMKANVDALTDNLARQIEISGAIDSDIKEYAAALAEKYNLQPEIVYDATFIPGTDHIQIRDEFSVTVEAEAEIMLFDGSFFDTVSLKIPISSEKPGISEKLWK